MRVMDGLEGEVSWVQSSVISTVYDMETTVVCKLLVHNQSGRHETTCKPLNLIHMYVGFKVQ